jgi:hypothetical protein
MRTSGKSKAVVPKSDGYFGKSPSWTFCRHDKEKWVFLPDAVFEHLLRFETMTWNEIMQASGGKSQGHGTNSHFVYAENLCREAQKRLDELKIYDDQIFSLRLSGLERLWGIIDDGVFHVVWHDKKHEVCPMS